jgi:hypothetical protein
MAAKRPDTPLAASPDANFEYTKKYADSKKKIEKNPAPSGVKVSTTGASSAKPYEKKFIPATSKRTNAIIVDGKGKKVKEASTAVGSRRSNDQLYREYKRDSTNTMDRRNRNANIRNISVGAKKELSASDLKILKTSGKIKNK